MNYESEFLRAVTGPAIRPGGMELTCRAADFCSFSTGARLLDVGCGNGATVGFLRDRRMDACGVDISSLLLTEGKARDSSLPLLRARAELLPFADCSLDGVFCECVLSLLPDPLNVLREFFRVLSRGGRLILSDIYLRGQGTGNRGQSSERVDGCLKGAVAHSVTKTMVEETGFIIILWEDHTRCLRELAARLVLAGYTPQGLREAVQSAGCGYDAASERLGYYLLVARKE